jgi:hypothetical protein
MRRGLSLTVVGERGRDRHGETDRHSGSRRGGARIGATLTEMGGGRRYRRMRESDRRKEIGGEGGGEERRGDLLDGRRARKNITNGREAKRSEA